MSETQKQWGVTPPISTVGPTDQENTVNIALIDELKRQNSFESQEESQRRIAVLTQLQKITEEFVRTVCIAKGLQEAVVNISGGKVFTFGSYRLGVYGPGSDIDTLMLCPAPVHRPDFFQYMPDMLAANPLVTELTPVLDAFVPIIKFKFNGISIDLIFARLNIQSVPINMTLEDKNLLRGSDETNLRCLNGTRVTDEILQLVPRVGVFRTALRGIKLWAQRRAIYANVVGFPGGVAWAMLVARICQLYPQAVGAVIISKFFRILGQWNWPQPVLLKGIEDGPLNVKVWNPKIYVSDRNHLMPIITPAYPSMCATHNITRSTKEIIIREMKRAAEIMDRIMVNNERWEALFQKHEFFTKGYKYYLAVVAASRDAAGGNLWSGLVESKLRILVMNMEKLDLIAIAHPFNKGFDKVYNCDTDEEAEWIAKGGCLAIKKPGVNDPLVEKYARPEKEIGTGPIKVSITTYYIGLELRPTSTKKLDISWPCSEFYEICRNWNNYNEDNHSIHINLTRNYDLPDNVFKEGEERPTKGIKVVKKKKVIIKKRAATEAGMDEQAIPPKRRSLGSTPIRGAVDEHSSPGTPSAPAAVSPAAFQATDGTGGVSSPAVPAAAPATVPVPGAAASGISPPIALSN